MTYRMALGVTAFALVAALVPAAVGAQTAGVYRLTELDGMPVPIVTDIDDEGRCREEVSSAALTLNNNGTWSLVTRDRKVCSGDFTEDLDQDLDQGIYRMDGSTIMFFDEEGGSTRDRVRDVIDDDDDRIDELEVGTLSPGALSVRLEDGSVAIFRR
jgi:hypothetical protein